MKSNKIGIYSTIGPTSLNKKFLSFAKNKVSLLRLNMSHIDLKNLKGQIQTIRKFSNIPICIDTEGAQIRTKYNLKKKFTTGKNIKILKIKKRNFLSLYPDNVFELLKTKDILSIGFEGLKLKILNKNEKFINAKCIQQGTLENNKGVSVDNRFIKLNPLTKKDLECIKIGKKLSIKYFALSFTNSINDIRYFNKLIPKAYKIFKIESKMAIKNLNEIMKGGKEFLIDRGDLSKEIGILNVPYQQRRILKKAKKLKKKISIATNFLESMIVYPYPTRAEVNDAYNALEQGTNNLVLAAETSIGKYPEGCVLLLHSLIRKFKKK